MAQFDKEASQTRELLRRKGRDASRGSPRSLAAQTTLARDDNQTESLPKGVEIWLTRANTDKIAMYLVTSGAIAQSGRAPRSQRGGRRFEPD